MARSRRRTRRGRRTRGSGANRALKIAAIATLPLIALGAGGYGLSEYIKIEQIDANYCYTRPDQAQTAVFLDYSVNKDLTGAQRRDLVRALERAYEDIAVNGRVMIFTTARDSGGSLADPVFVICRPAAGVAEQASIGAPSKPAPNLERIADDARESYRAQVERILADLDDSEKAAQESPILEQVQAISRYSGFQGQDRSFVWLSDGLQNSEFAQFGAIKGDMPPVAKFTRRSDYDLVRPDQLDGVSVTLLLVESIALPQAGLDFVTHREMRRWWPEYFRANGAEFVRLERLRRVEGS